MARLRDLRDYLDALTKLGDLTHISREVSADLEAAAMGRLSYERRSPAFLFENVAGVEPGFRLLGAPVGLSSRDDMPLARLALSVGLPPGTTASDLVEHLARISNLAPISPRRVARAEAACKQNVLLGAAATLDRFPVPMVHEHDGGPYPGTWSVIVARTPDGRWTNWSNARIMMIDDQHMTGQVVPYQHIGMIWQEWANLGEPMPFALVQGGDPAVPIIGGIPFPDKDRDEAGYIGALYGEPIDVVRCETVDLDVPASAEVVIEGHLSVSRDALEGPFGEFAGYMPTETSMQPIYTVEAITYRDDPIWPFVAEGRPVDEYHLVSGAGMCAEILAALRATGLPISTVWKPLHAAGHWTVITVPSDWRNRLPGINSTEFVHRIGMALQECRSGRVTSANFVLDDDIDPSDDAELLWALATRVHPHLRVEAFDGLIVSLMTCFTDEEREAGRAKEVIHDALLPAPADGRLAHSSFEQAYPEHIRKRVLEHWV